MMGLFPQRRNLKVTGSVSCAEVKSSARVFLPWYCSEKRSEATIIEQNQVLEAGPQELGGTGVVTASWSLLPSVAFSVCTQAQCHLARTEACEMSSIGSCVWTLGSQLWCCFKTLWNL